MFHVLTFFGGQAYKFNKLTNNNILKDVRVVVWCSCHGGTKNKENYVTSEKSTHKLSKPITAALSKGRYIANIHSSTHPLNILHILRKHTDYTKF